MHLSLLLAFLIVVVFNGVHYSEYISYNTAKALFTNNNSCSSTTKMILLNNAIAMLVINQRIQPKIKK